MASPRHGARSSSFYAVLPLVPKLARALALPTIYLALTVSVGVPADAQTAQEVLEELREDRERIQQEAAAQALQVDAATADFDVLAAALDDLNGLVDLQEARLIDAEQAVRSAETQVQQALEREAVIDGEVQALRSSVRDLALASFTGEGGVNGQDFTALLLSDDPTEAMRRRSLVEFQTGSLGDGIDQLRALTAEAELVSARRRDAAVLAEAGRAEAIERQEQLASAQAAQTELVLATEKRLEARLAEAAVLADRDAEAAALISQQEEVIAAQIRAAAARRAAAAAAAAAASDSANPPVVITPDEITTVRGIQVHRDIAGNLEAMMAAAAADGVALGGWGYRDNVEQIRLRQQNCGTSDFDIWERSASSCSPPTARPGLSQHEQGLAIDFTYNDGSITTHSNPGFVWLAQNASRWGFFNLPSEPWHWSTTGR